jgi:hypothetical protein
MSTSGGESYTHLLIPTNKTMRPTKQSVIQFIERVTQIGFVGKDCELRASQVIRTEPQIQERRNPFNGQTLKVQTNSRKSQPARRIKSPAEISLTDRQEYNFSLTSAGRSPVPPFALGSRGRDGAWQPFVGDCHMEITVHVRDALVRVCRFADELGHNSPPPSVRLPIYDEDCKDDKCDGFFEHPDSAQIIRIPNAGCARFWISFELGKWIWPEPVGNSPGGLDPRLISLAAEAFATDFVEAYDWI